MPLAKNENNKKESLTVDNEHTKIINHFDKEEKIIPKYEERIFSIQNTIKKLNENKTKNIEKIMELQDEIASIKLRIKNIKRKKKDYLLDNSKYIFEYFERKKEISNSCDNDNEDISNNSISSSISSKTINDFFNIKQPSRTNISTSNTSYNDEQETNTIINKYFNNITNTVNDMDKYYIDEDKCEFCDVGEFIFMENEGLLVCNNCCKTKKLYIENDKPSYKEPPKEVCFYAYKRINHLREILAQFQAKETTQIPDDVIDQIKNQLKKERITLADLTNKKTKEILKNLKYNKFYEHIPFIKEKLGIKPPVMSQELEDKLCNLFMEIQTPYSKYCPKDRVNFLNYYYTIYKLCELLGETQFLDYFPMLKDREKRIEQDSIWKKICRELDWEFIPTL